MSTAHAHHQRMSPVQCYAAVTTTCGDADADRLRADRTIDMYLASGGSPDDTIAGNPLIAAIANSTRRDGGHANAIARLLTAGGSVQHVVWNVPMIRATMDDAIRLIPTAERPSILVRVLADDATAASWAAAHLACLTTTVPG